MTRRLILPVALLLAGALAACNPEAPSVSGWVRATPTGATTGAGYLTITVPSADRLLSVTSDAGKVTLHETAVKDGVMSMRPMAKGLPLPAGETVAFRPGGRHLMFTGLKAPFAEGGKVPVVLNFKRASPVRAELPVRATAPESGHH